MAATRSKAETINYEDEKVYDRLMEMTGGRGPDRCIDAVGSEAHSPITAEQAMDKLKTALKFETDRPHVLREAIMCCRKGGRFLCRTCSGTWGGHAATARSRMLGYDLESLLQALEIAPVRAGR